MDEISNEREDPPLVNNLVVKVLKMLYPGMWQLPRNPDRCCIYRVPHCIREVNPEAYTPQLVIIGPLHRSLIDQALKSLKRGDDITCTKSMGYLNMEEHKNFYLGYVRMREGENTIDEFRRMIKADEKIIRESYSESTDGIRSQEFVEMVLHDSVFILIFILNYNMSKIYRHAMLTDPITEPCVRNAVRQDLMLLENQLPFFILEKLYVPLALKIFKTRRTFREIITSFFGFDGKITNNSKFKHITDMFRCVHVETLPQQDEESQTLLRQYEEIQTLLRQYEENQTLPQQYEVIQTLLRQYEENQTLPQQDEEIQTLPKQDEENQTLLKQDEENQTLPQQDEENQTLLKQIITSFFGFHGKITNNSKFKHITDMFRCVHVETLPKQDEENQTLPEQDEENQTLPEQDEENQTLLEQAVENQTLSEQDEENQTLLEQAVENQTLSEQDEENQTLLEQAVENRTSVKHIYNADKLHIGGVKFKAEGDEFSLNVTFKNGCLKMPCLTVHDQFEVTLRNIMALEQCHYPLNVHVCNYVHFLDHFIDTEKDVDLLVEKGIIVNEIGEPALVARMVNKLGLGIPKDGSFYSDIAVEVNAYYSNPVKGSMAILKRVYFSNLWTGTATTAAIFLLVMTLIQTVASIIQVMQNASK